MGGWTSWHRHIYGDLDELLEASDSFWLCYVSLRTAWLELNHKDFCCSLQDFVHEVIKRCSEQTEICLLELFDYDPKRQSTFWLGVNSGSCYTHILNQALGLRHADPEHICTFGVPRTIVMLSSHTLLCRRLFIEAPVSNVCSLSCHCCLSDLIKWCAIWKWWLK